MELTTTSGSREGLPGNGTASTPLDSDQFSRALLSAMLSFRAGDFAARMPADLVGVEGKIADAFNHVVALAIGVPGRRRASPGQLGGKAN